jgi:KDO2-lipid IV(A) lauroyltransferase
VSSRKAKLSWREWLIGSLEIATHWSLRLLPIDLCSYLGFLLGRLLGPRHKEATQRLRNNIQQLRPDLTSPQQIDAMVKRAWGNYGRVMTEFSVLRRIWRSQRVHIEGMENLVLAKNAGKPIIGLFLHLGNWEVVGPKLYDLVDGRGLQIYQVLDNRFKFRIAENIRRPYAHALITNSPSVGKKLYNKLTEGYHLTIAIDEFVNGQLKTPSFGRPVSRSGNLKFAIRLAKLTNATLFIAYATRTQGARFLIHFLPPIIHDFTQIEQEKLHEVAKEIDALVDPIVRRHFDQWFYGASLNLNSAAESSL